MDRKSMMIKRVGWRGRNMVERENKEMRGSERKSRRRDE